MLTLHNAIKKRVIFLGMLSGLITMTPLTALGMNATVTPSTWIAVIPVSHVYHAEVGQQIVVTRALLSHLHTADECAFIISHELSHILLNHVAKTQFRHVGLSLLDALLVQRYTDRGSLLQMAGETGIGLFYKA